MDPKKSNGAPSTFTETVFLSSGSSASPREEAEAETERLKARSDSPAGRTLFQDEMADRFEARMQRQREQWEKERAAQLAHMDQILKVVDQAVVSGFENLKRARQLAEIANEKPEPRMSNAEGFVEVGKALISTAESLISKVLERDPEAAARLQNLGRQALGMAPVDEPQPATVPPAPPIATAEPAAPAAPPLPVLGKVVAAIQAMSAEQLEQLAEQHGVRPEELPLDLLMLVFSKQQEASPQGPAQ